MSDILTIHQSGNISMVSARELHIVLNISRNFTTWWRLMLEHGFEENTDYKTFSNKGLTRKAIADYLLTFETAKEIATIYKSKEFRDIIRQLQKGPSPVEKFLNKNTEAIEAVEKLYSDSFEGWEFSDRFKVSVNKFITELGFEEVYDSMRISCLKMHYNEDKALRYFCGICWKKINGDHE